MNRLRNTIFYTIITGGFTILIFWIIRTGKSLETVARILPTAKVENPITLIKETFIHNLTHPLAILLLQIITIILVARLFGWFCKKIGQPSVIGEIAAGIVLGPSLSGIYFPEFSTVLFPEQSLGNLQLLSQVGLILFMFVVGMELDLKVVKNHVYEAVVVSHASITIPFALGLGLAYFIYQSFAPVGVSFMSFGLFLGISMSITAFPVLARIVQERGMHKTKLGTVVITCAAVDDISAWSLLAVVIALVKAGSFIGSLPVIVMATGYVIFMFKIVKPFLKRVGELHSSRENLSKPVIALFFLVLLLSAYATETIGIHALFGAFMAGVVMPDNQRFKTVFIEKVEDIALVLLLPLFFVFTGLRTEIGLLNDPYLWKICGLVILVAITGKFAGSALAAKFTGQSWHDSLTIGALMNTRGLVELVALNIGYDLGVLSPEIFTMLVIMALVTTFMTAPALHLIDKFFRKKATTIAQETADLRKYKILISFGKPEMGSTLLKLADYLVKNKNGDSHITALHLSPKNLFNNFKMEEDEREGFEPLLSESQRLNRQVLTLFKASENIESDIAETANNGSYDLLLVGIGHSIFKGSLLGNLLGYSANFLHPKRLLNKVEWKEKLFGNSPFAETTRQILTKSKIPVGILINNNLHDINKIIMPVFGREDGYLVEYARKFIVNSGIQITVMDATGKIKMDNAIKENIRSIEQFAPSHLVLHEKGFEKELFNEHELMLISLESWRKLVESKSVWLKNLNSVLIVKP
jgi:Kef-type K+ transport system membrane component KefB